MPRAIIIEEFGGPEVMQMVESPVLPPNSHEVAIRNTAIGLNFIDTYQSFRFVSSRVHLNTIMPLADVAEAHANLESRSTTGSTILKP